ncbi:sugar ABC transporter substrate-binding protein [Microbacterium sp. RD1]|uniref:sugar ABC transporter substrate-binding protein n=1 Tax=Microbacterium sp. RD1 TaxID=3457313 RepID=UPI003FA5A00A
MHRSPLSRRLGTALVAGAGVLALLAGCASSGGTGGSDTDTGDAGVEGKTIAFLGYGDTNPWGAAFNADYVPALEAEGVEVIDYATMDPGTQVQNFNQAVAEQPDAIVVALVDTAAMVAPIKKAVAAGVPVIVFDGRPDPAVAEEEGVRQVLSDNAALGRFAAENIIEGLQAQGKDSGNIIVIKGTASMLVTQDRMEAFTEALEGTGYTVIAEEDGNWDPTLSGTIATSLLSKFGADGVDAAFGMADYMAIPIVEAAKQQSIPVGPDGLIVTGSNCFKAGIDSITAGELYGTATEDPETIAAATVDYTLAFLRGEEPERVVTVPSDRVTAETVDTFAEQCSFA